MRKAGDGDRVPYRYDVFGSFDDRADGAWVHGWLLPRLLQAGFTIGAVRLGAPSISEAERLIVESRNAVVVLSPGWVTGNDTKYDFLLLLHEDDPKYSRRKIIPIMLKECAPEFPIPTSIRILEHMDFADDARLDSQLQRFVGNLREDAPLPVIKWGRVPAPGTALVERRTHRIMGAAAIGSLALTVLIAAKVVAPDLVHRTMPKGFGIADAPFETISTNGSLIRPLTA